jgi:hypothetical protein
LVHCCFHVAALPNDSEARHQRPIVSSNHF